jgi:hypothetical protein
VDAVKQFFLTAGFCVACAAFLGLVVSCPVWASDRVYKIGIGAVMLCLIAALALELALVGYVIVFVP